MARRAPGHGASAGSAGGMLGGGSAAPLREVAQRRATLRGSGGDLAKGGPEKKSARGALSPLFVASVRPSLPPSVGPLAASPRLLSAGCRGGCEREQLVCLDSPMQSASDLTSRKRGSQEERRRRRAMPEEANFTD